VVDLDEVRTFLRCATPDAWFDAALGQTELLLIDHANCEKKAAGTALSLLYRYVDRGDLLDRLSRLAREELRHFEQVVELMRTLDVDYVHVSASRYAGALRRQVRRAEPDRLIDTLLVSAIVEARSCERFAGLVSRFDALDKQDAFDKRKDLARFYERLLESEARHFADYLELAEGYADAPIADRLATMLDAERDLIESPDPEFRFHSGVPMVSAVA
jgi:tRNA-(ms[2]io[6]A)-hydroxylase